MVEILKRILAALTKKLLLVGGVLVVWVLGIFLPESVTLAVAKMLLSLNSGYEGRDKWLRAYWTGENPPTR
jgi:hypothetical protein